MEDQHPQVPSEEATQPETPVYLPPTHEFVVGDRVRIFLDPPAGVPQEGTVKVVSDDPGKHIGVELDHMTDFAHSLDGLVSEQTDPVRGVVVGKGWWTRPENIQKV